MVFGTVPVVFDCVGAGEPAPVAATGFDGDAGTRATATAGVSVDVDSAAEPAPADFPAGADEEAEAVAAVAEEADPTGSASDVTSGSDAETGLEAVATDGESTGFDCAGAAEPAPIGAEGLAAEEAAEEPEGLATAASAGFAGDSMVVGFV